MKRISFAVLLFLALVVTPACSSFESDYAQRAGKLQAFPTPVEGAWEGRWQSEKGHGGGELRAIITPVKQATVSAAKEYVGRFKAKWGFFSSEYSASVTSETDITRMSTAKILVEANLGWLAGGKFSMDGQSTGNSINAKYQSSNDAGTIELKKVGD